MIRSTAILQRITGTRVVVNPQISVRTYPMSGFCDRQVSSIYALLETKDYRGTPSRYPTPQPLRPFMSTFHVMH